MTIQIKPDVIVFCDASVLYQAQIRDLLLEICVHHDLFRLRWSQKVQDEWINKLSERFPKASKNLEKTRKRMENAVPDCLVSNYSKIEENLKLPDMNDRHVLAAAIHSGSEFLLTENLRDFPKSVLSFHHIMAISVNDLIYSIVEQHLDILLKALKSIIKRLKNPPMTLEDWCLRMGRIGFLNSSKLILDSLQKVP